MGNFEKRLVCIEYIMKMLLLLDAEQLAIIKAVVIRMVK